MPSGISPIPEVTHTHALAPARKALQGRAHSPRRSMAALADKVQKIQHELGLDASLSMAEAVDVDDPHFWQKALPSGTRSG